MNELFDEPINVLVNKSSSTIVPTPAYHGMGIHHESHHLLKLEEAVAAVGGTVHGEEVHV